MSRLLFGWCYFEEESLLIREIHAWGKRETRKAF